MKDRQLDSKLLVEIREKAAKLTETDNYETYFTKLLEINLDNLTENYLQARKQASRSFWLTAGTAVAGFCILVAGIVLSFIPIPGTSTTTDSVAVASGLIVQFISGVMFYLYNKTVEQLNVYHDKLLRVQDLVLALKLIQSIADRKVKVQNLEYLAKSIVSYQTTGAKTDAPTSEADAKDQEMTPGDDGRPTRNGQGIFPAEPLLNTVGRRSGFPWIFRRRPAANRTV